jgi:hypothetical protein
MTSVPSLLLPFCQVFFIPFHFFDLVFYYLFSFFIWFFIALYFSLLFYSYFIPVFFAYMVLFLAYPNLLRNKMLGCCCCIGFFYDMTTNLLREESGPFTVEVL